jgi:hypothetical protein
MFFNNGGMWLVNIINQLKLKVAEMTQTKVTLFQNGILGKTWW